MKKNQATGAGMLAVALLIGACAPAPLYTSSGLHRGAATWGEIPRDARGEPVWAAIRPVPPGTEVMPQAATAPSMTRETVQEGDAEAPPTPPKA